MNVLNKQMWIADNRRFSNLCKDQKNRVLMKCYSGLELKRPLINNHEFQGCVKRGKYLNYLNDY
jgi:hypothetical protein